MKPKNTEEVVDMEEDDDGTFHPIVPYRRPNIDPSHLPQSGGISPGYQFLDGFILGLEAIENFMRNTKRLSRNWFNRRY
jgi:hypothetical protein